MFGKRILAAMIVLVLSAPALASQMSVPDGWYIEGNAGYSHLSNLSIPGSINASGVGGNANLGYKFMPYVAAEIGYSLYSGASIKDSAGVQAAKGKPYSYDIALRGILPIVDSGFELFAKLGAERITTSYSIKNQTAAALLGISSGSHSATGLYLGVGGQYYIMPELAIVAQWQRAQGNHSSGTADLYSVGFSFIFV